MKQLFLTGLLVGGALLSAQAQSGYDDDIYSSAPAAPSGNSSGYNNSGNSSTNSGNYRNDDDYNDNRYGNNGNYNSGNYADDYDYIDYADDYSYSTRFRRFHAPFYNVGYWSGFWTPFDYDPYFGSPWYGGYGYGGWGRPGVYVSVNLGGPYWSSGWGYNTWYGYGGFSSYWGYPHYAGWGGYGSGYNWGYRNGYWDGYYAGLYGAGHGYSPYAYRQVNYAPRTAIGGVNGFDYRRTPVSGNRASAINNGEFRGGNRGMNVNPSGNSGTTAPVRANPSNIRPTDRDNIRISGNDAIGGVRNPTTRDNSAATAPDRNIRESAIEPTRNTNPRGGFFGNNNDRAVESNVPIRNNGSLRNDRISESTPPVRNTNPRGGFFGNNDRTVEQAPVRETTRPRGGFFGNNDRAIEPQQTPRNNGWQNQRSQPDRSYSTPQPQIERRQMPRFEQRSVETPRSQPRFEAPQRMSAPSGGGFSAPSRSMPSAPSGGNRGGGGFRR